MLDWQYIVESHSGGKPKNRHDWLEHIWSFNLSGGNHIFNVYAYRMEAGDNDSGFELYWSQSQSGPWELMFTVTAQNDIYQKYDIGNISGTVYVRVIDNDKTPGHNENDTLVIDYMFFDGGEPQTDIPDPASNPIPNDEATNVSRNPILSWSAGYGSESNNVYFGTDPDLSESFQGNQTGTTFSPGVLSYNTSYYWRIDEVNEFGTNNGAVWSFTTMSEPPVSTSVHVDSIQVSTASSSKGRKYGQVTVTIFDNNGNPVPGAEVTGIFTGDYSETVAGTTDEYGTVVLTTIVRARKPSYTFCVTGVSHEILTYDPDGYDNVETCKIY